MLDLEYTEIDGLLYPKIARRLIPPLLADAGGMARKTAHAIGEHVGTNHPA